MAAPEKEPRAPRARMTGTERRHQLIDIARSLFAERGYAETRVLDIVQAAGVANVVSSWHGISLMGRFASTIRID